MRLVTALRAVTAATRPSASRQRGEGSPGTHASDSGQATRTAMLVWGHQSTGISNSNHWFRSRSSCRLEVLLHALTHSLAWGPRARSVANRSFASPCIRSSLQARYPDSACTERPSDRTDPSPFRCFIQALLRSRPPLERSLQPAQAFKTTPSGTIPVSTNRHRATTSLRAKATIAMRLRRPFALVTRSRYQAANRLSG